MFSLKKQEFIVGLGSNHALSLEKLRQARHALRVFPGFVLKGVSSLYESEPLLPQDAPIEWNRPYLNAACWLELKDSAWEAHQIVSILKQIEVDLGRQIAPRWSPRVIDLDLLCWGQEPVCQEHVIVPHPGLLERPFALLPVLDCLKNRLQESNPWFSHPWQWADPEQIPLQTRISPKLWPEQVGILNWTPDSFSDGGELKNVMAFEQRLREKVAQGVSIIDLGVESTRPGAVLISYEQERERLKPIVQLLAELKQELKFQLSFDSRHPETLRWAIQEGLLDWVNNVQGADRPEILKVLQESDCHVVLMHTLGVPPQKNRVLSFDLHPVSQILNWAYQKLEYFEKNSIHLNRVIFDPGIGYGKTAAQNLSLVLHSNLFHQLPCRMMIGHSRKQFLDPDGKISPQQRDLETAILTSALNHVDYLRIHAPDCQTRALQLGSRCRW